MSHHVTDFQKDVLERSRRVPVLVDFWAAWCGPCRALGPILERIAAEAQGRWELAKLDTEELPDVAAAYGIVSIPNVKLFVNGEIVDEFVGLMPEREIRRWLDHSLPSPRAATIAEAKQLIAGGSFERAASILRPVVEAEPANAEARVRLAEALLHTDPEEVATTLRVAEDDPQLGDGAEALRTLAGLVTSGARPAELPESPAKPGFIRAALAIHHADYAAALEALLEVLQRDREYAGGAGKVAGRAIFVLLGLDHPISERYHRAFSSALYV